MCMRVHVSLHVGRRHSCYRREVLATCVTTQKVPTKEVRLQQIDICDRASVNNIKTVAVTAITA